MKKIQTELKKKIGKRCLKNLSEERYHKMSEIVINIVHTWEDEFSSYSFWHYMIDAMESQ